MSNTEDRHYEKRLSNINRIISELEYYKDFIVDLSMFNSAEEYKKVTYVNAFGEVDFL